MAEYITTGNVHVFPSTFRTGNEAEGKYTSENNLTNIVRSLTNGRDFYVKTNGSISLISIHGYIFNIASTVPSKKLAYILIDGKGRLVQSNAANNDLDVDGNFVGLGFDDNAPEAAYGCKVYSLDLTDTKNELPIGANAINGLNLTVDNSKNVTTNINGKAISSIFETNGTTAKNATNVTTNINGKAISNIFEENGTTIKNATNVTTNINGKAITNIFEEDGVTAQAASKWKTARNFTIKDYSGTNEGPSTSVDGSGDEVIKLPDTIKASLDGNATSATSATNVALSATVDGTTKNTTIKAGTGTAATISSTGYALKATNVDLTASAPTTSSITISAGTGNSATINSSTTSAAGLMSKDDKVKLNGVASGALVNVQSDWNATSGDAFIKNKPAINNGTLTILKNGANVATFTANQSTNVTANISVPVIYYSTSGPSGGSDGDIWIQYYA